MPESIFAGVGPFLPKICAFHFCRLERILPSQIFRQCKAFKGILDNFLRCILKHFGAFLKHLKKLKKNCLAFASGSAQITRSTGRSFRLAPCARLLGGLTLLQHNHPGPATATSTAAHASTPAPAKCTARY